MKRIFSAMLLLASVAAATYPAPSAPPPPLLLADSSAPAGWDRFAPPVRTEADRGAPEIAECTRSGAPGDCLIVSGTRLSAFADERAGRDTRFVAWGQSGDFIVEADCEVVRLSGDLATIRLPSNLPPWSTYAVWPVNADGWGRPFLLNRTETWWLFPQAATPGGTLAVFGRQLAHGDGTTASWILVRRPDGSGARWLTVAEVDPYRVACTLPADLGTGRWEVYAHNGHGGAYGWSRPLTVDVATRDATAAVVLSGADYGMVPDDDGDDWPALDAALTALRDAPAGSTLQLATGTFRISKGIIMPDGRNLRGAGRDATILVKAYQPKADGAPFDGNYYSPLFGNLTDVEISDLTIRNDDNGNGYLGFTMAHLRDAARLRLTRLRLSQVGDRYGATGSILDLSGARDVAITGCEFITADGLFLGKADGLSFTDCTFLGINDCNALVYIWGGSRYAFRDCTARDYDSGDETSGVGWCKGRFIAGAGNWGAQEGVYVGRCQMLDLTPRRQGVDQNSGELLMWEALETSARIRPTTATGDRMGDGADRASLVGSHAIVSEGPGRGQSRRIVGWDPVRRELQLDEPWRIPPTGNSRVEVGNYLRRFAAFDNLLDGKSYAPTHPDHIATSGIQPYGGSAEIVVDRNRFRQLRTGISEWALGPGSQPVDGSWPLQPNCFHLLAGNTMEECRVGIMHYASASYDRGAIVPPPSSTAMFGHVYRRTTMRAVVEKPVANYGPANGDAMPFIGMTVYDNLVVDGTPAGLQLSQPQTRDQVVIRAQINGIGVPAGAPAIHATAGERPALRELTISGFPALVPAADEPAAILELPRRVLVLNARQGESATGRLHIWNAGAAPLMWTATADAAWLTPIPAGGAVADHSAIAECGLTALTAGLAVGTYEAIVTVSGNGGVQQATVRLLVEMPLAPTPAPPRVAGNGGDAAAIGGDAAPGTRVRVRIDGREVGSALAGADGRWTFAVAAFGAGAHAVAVAYDDGAGGIGPWSPAVAVVSTAVTAAPTLLTAGNLPPKVFGIASPGAAVAIREGGTTLATAVADPSGGWSAELPGLDARIHIVTARATAGAIASGDAPAIAVSVPAADGVGSGLAGTYFDESDFTVQRLVRVDPNIFFPSGVWGSTAPDASLTNPAWSVRWSGGIEARTTGRYRFRLPIAGPTRLRIDGAVVAEQASAGFWIMTIEGEADLVAGRRVPIQLEYRETDGNGEVWLMWAAPGQDMQVVPTAQLHPDVPGTPATPATPAAPTVGGDASAAPTLSGSAPAGATVIIRIDGGRAGTATADGGGAWSWPVPGTVAQGPHGAQVAVATAGGTSGWSATRSFIIGGVPAIPERGWTETWGKPALLLYGAAVPGAMVEIAADSPALGVLGTARVDAGGTWRFVVRRPGTAAVDQFTVRVVTASGTGPPTDPFWIPMGGPALPPPTPAAPTLTADGSPQATVGGRLDLPAGGTANVMVVVDGHHTAWIPVAGNGTWQWDVGRLGVGTYSIAAIAYIDGQASADSPAVTVHVAASWPPTAPRITVPPTDLSLVAGQSAVFAVAAEGTAPTFRWQRSTDGGATWSDLATGSALLSFSSAVTDHGARYRCIASNAAGSDTSAAAILTVVAAAVPPSYTTQPADRTVAAGATATFTVGVAGVPAPDLQWQRSADGGAGWSDIAGGTGTELAIAGAAAGDDGVQLRCRATNSAGSATSASARLRVSMPSPGDGNDGPGGGGSGGGEGGCGSGLGLGLLLLASGLSMRRRRQ